MRNHTGQENRGRERVFFLKHKAINKYGEI